MVSAKLLPVYLGLNVLTSAKVVAIYRKTINETDFGEYFGRDIMKVCSPICKNVAAN